MGLSQHEPQALPSVCLAAAHFLIVFPLQGDTRLEDDWVPDADGRTMEEVEESSRKNEAKNRWVWGEECWICPLFMLEEVEESSRKNKAKNRWGSQRRHCGCAALERANQCLPGAAFVGCWAAGGVVGAETNVAEPACCNKQRRSPPSLPSTIHPSPPPEPSTPPESLPVLLQGGGAGDDWGPAGGRQRAADQHAVRLQAQPGAAGLRRA